MTDTPVTPKRKRRVSSETKPIRRRNRKSGAAAEIDKRIAEIIKERTQATHDIAKGNAAQTRYQMLTQELHELIGMQAKLNPVTTTVMTSVPVADPVAMVRGASPFVVGAGVPPGVGSIPTAHANVADIAKGDGFE